MYAIRCTVHHPKTAQVFGVTAKSNYIILVDTPKVTDAFKVARVAMNEKFRNSYKSQNFDFASGAQILDGSLNGEKFKILFTNL